MINDLNFAVLHTVCMMLCVVSTVLVSAGAVLLSVAWD